MNGDASQGLVRLLRAAGDHEAAGREEQRMRSTRSAEAVQALTPEARATLGRAMLLRAAGLHDEADALQATLPPVPVLPVTRPPLPAAADPTSGVREQLRANMVKLAALRGVGSVLGHATREQQACMRGLVEARLSARYPTLDALQAALRPHAAAARESLRLTAPVPLGPWDDTCAGPGPAETEAAALGLLGASVAREFLAPSAGR